MIYLELLVTFFRIGILGFGGGYVIIPLLSSEIALHQWLTSQEFADIVAVSQMTPGPIGINTATFVGIRTAGFLGGLAATAGMILPSLLLVILAAHMMGKFKESAVIQAILKGIRPAVIGLIGFAVIFFASMSVLPGLDEGGGDFPIDFRALAVFLVVLILSAKRKIHPIGAIVISAVMGLALYAV